MEHIYSSAVVPLGPGLSLADASLSSVPPVAAMGKRGSAVADDDDVAASLKQHRHAI